MDDITQKLSQLLDSPDGMEKIKTLASSLLGSDGQNADSRRGSDGSSLPTAPSGGDGLDLSPDNLQNMMSLMNAFQRTSEDDRSRFLIALRPHLSAPRQERVDKAVKILKLVGLMPIITETGLLKDLF